LGCTSSPITLDLLQDDVDITIQPNSIKKKFAPTTCRGKFLKTRL